jgi:hypothetical protein
MQASLSTGLALPLGPFNLDGFSVEIRSRMDGSRVLGAVFFLILFFAGLGLLIPTPA